ncbi:MAG: twin-arginine translocase subunit TatC [Micrococcales bacterium]|nr:twin-arginine translocase subunit TatC [Micrococcales bacterium]
MPGKTRRKDPEGRMALADHLREFRRRLMVSALALMAGAIVGWIYYKPVYDQLSAPFDLYKQQSGNDFVRLNFGNATAAFSQRVSLSIFVGVIISSPIWLYQLWAFIVPGLTRKEKRVSLAFILSAIPLFLAGCGFAYYALPKALTILFSFTPEGASNIQQVTDYFSFVTRFIVVFGVAFLLPVFLVALVMAHVLSGRQLLKSWRVAVLLIFIAAAVITPTPDPFTMMLLGVPLAVLYFGAVGIALLIDRRRKDSEPDWMGLPDDQASPL